MLVGRVGRQPAQRLGDVGVAHAVEKGDRLSRIGNPEKVADSREQARRGLAPDSSHAQQRHHAIAVAGQQLVERDVSAETRTTGERVGDEVHFAFDSRGADQLVIEVALFVEQADERGSEIFETAPRIVARGELRTGV